MAASINHTERKAKQRPQVLLVGLTVVDMVTVAETYPNEDSDQRGISFRRQRGGNASNSCTVLGLLGTHCEYLGVLPGPSSPEHRWLLEDFSRYGIETRGCVWSEGTCPVATVLISQQTGSRTIIFCDNGQPELTREQFVEGVGDRLHNFSWIHFEIRRNVEDYLAMLKVVDAKRSTMSSNSEQIDLVGEWHSPQITVSVEIEKPELDQPERVMLLADVVFVSKDWALSRDWTDKRTAVFNVSRLCRPSATVICPWAEEGAAAWHENDVIAVQAKPTSSPVVDTLGAGDTFVAGFLHGRLQGMSVRQALTFACRLASVKCTQRGYDGLLSCLESDSCE